MRKDGMRGVARRAVRGNDQPLLEETLAVDAFGKILEDMILMDCPLPLNRGTFLMALAAEEGDFQRRGRGIPVF